MSTPSSRVLGAPEAYFQLVDRLWPVNSVLAVEISADPAAVAAAWTATFERMPVLGAQIRIVDRRPEVVFAGTPAPEIWRSFATVEEAMAAQVMEPLDTEQSIARCAIVEGDRITTAVLAAHHSLVDGRALIQVALTLGALASGEEPADQPLFRPSVSVDALVADRTDARGRRRELLALAREVRDEEGYVDRADPLTWHDTAIDRPRDIEYAQFRFDVDRSAALLAHARSIGATVYGVVCAALLRSCAELSPGVARVGLSTPVDLRAATRIPDSAPVGQAAALISGSYDVTVSDSELARAVSAGVRRQVDRGEAELLFALTGAARMPIGPESDEVVRRWHADATQTVCVSNIGVMPGPLPSAMRGVTMCLAPTPNQGVFFVVMTVGGQLHVTMGYDLNRISIDGGLLAKTIEARLVSYIDSQP
ncbi:phthiocerol/phthiodiolone dimycocerosyl transferase family protein [Smaragdicoccus niigatensis]|uniref:phthiocerol/phthiodiolone dimycocerosyl transferase family protein n=1 Tax=Smaragdicoccus niigatensis TaxID=359359 RepID=UPI0003767958|nr:hypothetical protein [Smaragdicoccus niigatensis]